MDNHQSPPATIGRYEIKAELGHGGMATVYRGFDPRFKRDVAIKVLSPELPHDPSFRSRFEREVETVAALEHSAIVPVYDTGEDEGRLFLVMRLMPGGSLADRLQHGPLTLNEAARIVSRVAAALDRAHSHGVVHRDVKPANILFDAEGEPYLSDFGLTRVASKGKDALTETGSIVGTPAYMSPEQARGEEIDGRSDIYALGATLFHMLGGRPPYEGNSPISILVKHITEPVPRILEANPRLPPACDALIQRAMAKKREERFATAGELAAALTAIAQGSSPAIRAAESAAACPETKVADLIEESMALEQAGDIAAALGRAREALELARTRGEPRDIASALVTVAHFRLRLGQYPATRALAEEALTLAPAGTPPQVNALHMLAVCASETEHLAEAEDYYRRAADLAREIGYQRARYRALNDLAMGIYLSRGQFDLAEAALQEALRLAWDLGLDHLLPYTLLALSWLYQFTGRRQKTRETLAELGQVAHRVALIEGYHANLSALLALDEGDLTAAPPLFAAARSVAEAIGEPRLNVETRLGMSRYHRLAGNPATARTWADEAVALTTRVGFSLLQGRALIERARAAWDVGDSDAAERDLRAATEVLTPLGADFDLARSALFLAALLHAQHRPEARPIWQEAAHRLISGGYAFLLEQERALAFPLVAAHLNDPDPETAALSAALLTHLARVPPPPLHVVTLGRFEVRQGARVVPDAAWRQRRAGELFRLLLVSPEHTLPREQIIETLWPDKSPGAANAPFHQATSALRQALEPDLPDKFPSRYLEVEGRHVSLRLPPDSWLDWQAFEQHIRQGEWAEAVALYGGELFPDDRYADWAATPRERLARQFIAALLALARGQLAAGNPQEALASARRLLEIDPWQENAVLIGMQACLALGDRAGALHLYHDLEQVLRQELGIAPQEELQRLYHSLG